MKKLVTFVAIIVAFAVLFTISGCKKKTAPAVEVQTATPAAAAVTDQTATPAVDIVAASEQTTCPVMGGTINKDIFAEYQGKKVYFCCPQCKGEFEKAPEKYIGKLPQFAK